MPGIIKVTKEIQDFIKIHYVDMGPKAIAKVCNISAGSVYLCAKRHNLKMTPEQRNKLVLTYRRKDFKDYNVNPEQFLDIKTEEVAYILGYLWADGYLNNCRSARSVNLHIVDKDALDIKETLEKTGKWNFYFRKRPNKQDQYAITTSNRPLYEFLESCDYKNKNGIAPDKILSKIPENLHYMFFRGLFDGDGCLYINKTSIQFNITSVYNQDWDFIIKKLIELDIKNYKINRCISTKGHECSKIRFQGKSSVPKFLDYIYKNREIDKIGLDRKYDKYKSINRKRRTPVPTNIYPHVTLLHYGKFLAIIGKTKKNGLKKDVRLGTFDDGKDAIKAVKDYIEKNNLTIIEKTHETNYDSSI